MFTACPPPKQTQWSENSSPFLRSQVSKKVTHSKIGLLFFFFYVKKVNKNELFFNPGSDSHRLLSALTASLALKGKGR